MPLSHWRYVAVQKCWWWNCCQNPSAELILIYDSQDESLDIWNVLYTVCLFSSAPETLIACYQASNSSKRMENCLLKRIRSFKSIPSISFSSRFAMLSVWALHQVVDSVLVLDRRSRNFTCVLAVMFSITETSSSGAVFTWASFVANVVLGPVTFIPTSSYCCLWWCWNNLSKSWHLAGIRWWIWCSNCLIVLHRTATDLMVVACQALFRSTWNCLHFDAVTFSALST